MHFEIIEGHWSNDCNKSVNCVCASYLVVCKENNDINSMFNTIEEAQEYVNSFDLQKIL